ncbi:MULTISPECIES: acyl carrier protein [unclassified Caballeronia]|uniref:acyl carrier protein n=1 Tax=unclassified Caballeronia TaxID=2646786 RepID=UPI001F49C775|nr:MULTISPECIES: acyl carrier protein [unclassified Caballeronia]
MTNAPDNPGAWFCGIDRRRAAHSERITLRAYVAIFKESLMSSVTTQLTIEQFIEQFLIAVDFQDPVEVTAETELLSLPEWDSLASLGVIVMFDTDFGKTISGDDIKKCVTLADLHKLLG